MPPGPLAGVRILEFTQIIAGPFGGMLLADMGAEVIKFEPLEGEPWRQFTELIPGESRTFASLNRGKKDIAIDLRRPEARELIYRLVPEADVVLINYRPGVAESLGIDYDSLRAHNPRIIYCENTAFGRKGPLAKRGGYDIVVQAMSGLMAGEGKMDGDVPTYVYPAVADYATGIMISNSICAALYAREKTGQGQRIDCTLLGTAMAMQTSQFTWIDAFDGDVLPHLLTGLREARLEQKSFQEQQAVHRKYRPVGAGNIYYRVYQTADGFIAVGALSRQLWAKVSEATGIVDPRSGPNGIVDLNPPGWDEEGPKLVAKAEALFLTKTTAEWGAIFERHGVPAGPMHYIEELFDHPQTAANGLVAEIDHPLLGHLRMVGPPFQMSATPLAPQGPSPVLGADGDAVLGVAGYSEVENPCVAGERRDWLTLSPPPAWALARFATIPRHAGMRGGIAMPGSGAAGQELGARLIDELGDMLRQEADVLECARRSAPFVAGHPGARAYTDRIGGIAAEHSTALCNRLAALEAGLPAVCAAPKAPDATGAGPTRVLQTVSAAAFGAVAGYATLLHLACRARDSWIVATEGTTAHIARQHLQDYQIQLGHLPQLLGEVIAWELDQRDEWCLCICAACGMGFCMCVQNLVWREAWTAARGAMDGDGVRISTPRPGSAAATAGFTDGDVLLHVNGVATATGPALITALKHEEPGGILHVPRAARRA